jgi:hypothetical protein
VSGATNSVARSFSPFRESESGETDFEFWFRSAEKRGLTWDNLLKQRLVVVLGEAGIGKTYEFDQQVRRLESEGKRAFLISLNLLERPEDWDLALGEQLARFRKWASGTEPGIFFLDAVDEARLTGATALRRSLDCVRRGLDGYGDRLSFFVSSRISDWNLRPVREMVEQQLRLVIASSSDAEANISDATPEDMTPHEGAEIAVYCLSPLSSDAARQLAVHYGVKSISTFWSEVDAGGYTFLASRPLDLEWMVSRWNDAGRLGSYSEVIEAAVANRLLEKNPGHIEAEVVLAAEEMRRGAETVAAACVFSGMAYVQVEPGVSQSGTLAPAEVLHDWKPHAIPRLLGSAIFDEATYGRVKFHHRAVREYLAACWVKRQLDLGLPFAHGWVLFAQAPYGDEVLIPSRRAVLCWLAALDAKVRGHVVRSFPEMVSFEGDPQQWSEDDVVDAFGGYLDRLKSGFRTDWWNDASELHRVARVIPSQQILAWLEQYRDDSNVLPKLLTIVKNGRIGACANWVFALYQSAGISDRQKRLSLDVLSEIATPSHKAFLTADVLAGRMSGNDLIADCIEAIGLSQLSVEQLVKCFGQTASESEHGGGPMATAVNSYLLPDANSADARKLLAALLEALPTRDVRILARRVEEGKGNEGWMLSVMPDVLLKVLQLTPTHAQASSLLLVDAAFVVENLRHTVYADDQDFRALRQEIERFPELRKDVAMRIARSDIPHAASTLIWQSGVVHFGLSEMDGLVESATQEKIAPADRAIWYCTARDLAFRELRGRKRRNVLSRLMVGPDADARRAEISVIASQYIESVRTRQKWAREDRSRKRKVREQEAINRDALLKQIDGIRQGSAFGAIQWLVVRASDRSGHSRYSKVDIDVVYREFGSEIGAAFNEGLARAWRYIDAPGSTKYLDNSVPWAGLIGLASANYAFRNGLRADALSDAEVRKLAHFCVWELGDLDEWFAVLVEYRLAEVAGSLTHFFEFELSLVGDEPIRRTIDMVIRGPVRLRAALLPLALDALKHEVVPNERLRRTLVSELAEAGLADTVVTGDFARQSLDAGLAKSPPTFLSSWFGDWACADFPAAWKWFVSIRGAWLGSQADLVNLLAEAVGRSSDAWKALTGAADHVSALTEMFRLLNAHLNGAGVVANDESLQTAARELWNRIPEVLAGLGGQNAYQALLALAAENEGSPVCAWLKSKAREKAARDSEDVARIVASDFSSIGDMFTREPNTEVELFEQVMARLEEIADGVERGPFSERGLFSTKTPEKQLQLWLASRLEDTPRRRFTSRFAVFREPTVDADKRTDIEVSTKAGKVCIEIKPLDAARGYSAHSLVEDTLKRQVVGQYLRGKNSRHGMLVILRLDRKTWQIPGQLGNHRFEELVGYLREQARSIVASDEHVLRLEVLAIDCTSLESSIGVKSLAIGGK